MHRIAHGVFLVSLLLSLSAACGTDVIPCDGVCTIKDNPDRGALVLFSANFSPEQGFSDDGLFLGVPFPGLAALTVYRLVGGDQASVIDSSPSTYLRYTSWKLLTAPWQEDPGLKAVVFPLLERVESFQVLARILFLRYSVPYERSLFVAGLVPMTRSNYTIELERPRSEGFAVVQTPYSRVIIDRLDRERYAVDSYFEDGSSYRFKRLVAPAHDGRITLTVAFDGVNKTNTVSSADGPAIETPFFSQTSARLPYPVFSGGYVKISDILSPVQDSSEIRLYTLTQSAPRRLITPIGDRTLQPFGLDGPHDNVTEGIAYMEETGSRGTIWVDLTTSVVDDPDFRQYVMALLQNSSWDLGVHYTSSLNDLDRTNKSAVIAGEYETIAAMMNGSPTSWCSLRNGDTVADAEYIFRTTGMIWRNGETGVLQEHAVGNLDDQTWDWWINASRAGLAYPVFTHQTDVEPAIPFSISLSRFRTWIDNYRARGMSIVPFYEWWQVNANTHDATVRNITIGNHSLAFALQTNGMRALLDVDVPPLDALVVTDRTANMTVPWTRTPQGSVAFYGRSGHEYEIDSPGLPTPACGAGGTPNPGAVV